MPPHYSRFGCRRRRECVWTFRSAAGVEGDFLACCLTGLQHFLTQQFMLIGHTQVIHLGLNFRIIVSCTFYAIVGISFIHNIPCCTKHLHRTLIHGYAGLVKPALLLQMGCEILQERQQEFRIFLSSGVQLQQTGAVHRLIKILKGQMPGNNGIAVYLLVNAKAHHEFNPFVKDSIIVFPLAIQLSGLSYHTLKRVFCLTVPGMLYDGGGNHLLPCISKQFHQRTHVIKVGLAPQRHIVIACHSIRVLPQIQVERPVFGCRQHMFVDLNRKRNGCCLAVTVHRKYSRVFPRSSILRDTDVQPYRTERLRGNRHLCQRREPVGHQTRVKHGTIQTQVLMLSVFIAITVSHGIAYKILIDCRSWNNVLSALQVAHLGRYALNGTGSQQNSLCTYALSSPSRQLQLGRQSRDSIALIPLIYCPPPKCHRLNSIPCFRRCRIWVLQLILSVLCHYRQTHCQ